MRYIYFTLLIAFASCTTPNIDYLGNDYDSTEEVDVYFSPGDIDEFFTVMGQMNANNENEESLSLDDMEDAMICEAKEKGADAILFLDFETFDGFHYVKADLLIYEF